MLHQDSTVTVVLVTCMLSCAEGCHGCEEPEFESEIQNSKVTPGTLIDPIAGSHDHTGELIVLDCMTVHVQQSKLTNTLPDCVIICASQLAQPQGSVVIAISVSKLAGGDGVHLRTVISQVAQLISENFDRKEGVRTATTGVSKLHAHCTLHYIVLVIECYCEPVDRP